MAGYSQQQRVRRFGQLAQIKPGQIEKYRDLHAAIWPVVVDMEEVFHMD